MLATIEAGYDQNSRWASMNKGLLSHHDFRMALRPQWLIGMSLNRLF